MASRELLDGQIVPEEVRANGILRLHLVFAPGMVYASNDGVSANTNSLSAFSDKSQGFFGGIVSTIAERLAEIQGEKSSRQFAMSLGISPSTWWEYLQGREPPMSVLILIGKKLGIDVWWLSTGEGPKYFRRDACVGITLSDELGSMIARLEELRSRVEEMEMELRERMHPE